MEPFSVSSADFTTSEPDTAAGNFGDFVRGAESGRKNQLKCFGFVQLRSFFVLIRIPRSMARRTIFSRSRPWPSSETSITT